MGILRSQGYLYSVEDVLETLVRDLQESRGQGMLSLEGGGRQLWAVQGDGRREGWALCDKKDGIPPQEVCKLLRGVWSALPALFLSLQC